METCICSVADYFAVQSLAGIDILSVTSQDMFIIVRAIISLVFFARGNICWCRFSDFQSEVNFVLHT